jgi:seryl-tRNA synthetase
MTAPRRYQRLPDSRHLNERIVKLNEEAVQILERHHDLLAQRNALTDEAQDKLALDTDRQAASIAVRNGRSAASVGKPAQDKLTADRLALDAEIDALIAALANVEDEMQAEFETMVEDDRASGRSSLASAENRYRKAVSSLTTARSEYVQIRAVVGSLKEAAAGSNNQVLNQALRAADELIPMAVPPNMGIDPRYAPRLPFDKHLAVLTAELNNEES